MKRLRVLLAFLTILLFASPLNRGVSCADVVSSKIQNNTKDIAEEWPAHLAFLIMLGAENRVYETNVRIQSVPWLLPYYPSIDSLLRFGMISPNPESLLAKGIRIVFLPSGQFDQAKNWRKVGLQTYSMPVGSYKDLLTCVDTTAEILGSDEARHRAQAFRARWEKISQTSKSSKVVLKPKVLHISSLYPLLIDGKGTLIDEWINLSGGENVAKYVRGNRRPTDWQQVVAWSPDIVILESDAGQLNALESKVGQLFLKTHKVVHNPAGIFLWDRYGPETLLQIEWATDLFRDGKVNQDRWVPKVQHFYKEVYHLDISEEDAQLMLRGQPPNKTNRSS